MSRRTIDEDRDEGPEDWDDEPDDWDDGATDDCPWCGEEIAADAPRCPYCGRYLSAEDAPPARKPLWILIGTAICLYIVYRWIVG